MAEVDWKAAWRDGVTPWDAGRSPPALHELLDRGLVPAGRILVPGCGTGYDLATLASDDRDVVGLDLSEEARDAFEATHAGLRGSVSYRVLDFFCYAPDVPFDFVWDYTFFCALPPNRRDAWADAMKRLVNPAGVLATLLFPYEDPITDRQGPPWPVNRTMVANLFQDAFALLEVQEPKRSHAGRGGREQLALWRRR